MRRQEKGIVSLLTTIIFSILLLILTIGMVALANKALKEASDGDQSTRAYFAAENGVEDALARLKLDPAFDTGGACLPAADPDLGYTCMRVSKTQNVFSGSLQPEEATQIDLATAPAIASMKILWHTSGSTPPSVPSAGFPSNGGTWPYPAALEVAVVSYRSGATNLTLSDIIQQTVVIRPQHSIGVAPQVNSPVGSNPADGACSTKVSGYWCSTTITGFNHGAPQQYLVRMRPRFAGTDYQIVFQDSAGRPVAIASNVTTIDVTAKSGDVFRRVVTKVDTTGGVLSGLDYVIYSDTDICKSLQVSSPYPTLQAAGCPLPPVNE